MDIHKYTNDKCQEKTTRGCHIRNSTKMIKWKTNMTGIVDNKSLFINIPSNKPQYTTINMEYLQQVFQY